MKQAIVLGLLLANFAQAEGPAQNSKLLKLTVNKMMCGGCVSRVKKAIEAHPGVNNVHVSLETHDASFTCSDAKTCPTGQILNDLKRIGFPSKLQSSSEN